MIDLYTIGFTKKRAEQFFGLLIQNKIDVLVDVRLKPDVQLSGFAKKSDLPYFMDRLVHGKYIHVPEAAPTAEILDGYRQDHNWSGYVEKFEALMRDRGIVETLDRGMFEQNRCCLLCSEHLSDQCHRRLLADRIAKAWDDVRITHLS